jgi:hypothetical protein
MFLCVNIELRMRGHLSNSKLDKKKNIYIYIYKEINFDFFHELT